MTIRQLWPLLPVSDIDRSVGFYRDKLGFTIVGEANDDRGVFWCRLGRAGASIMLERTGHASRPLPQGAPAISLYFVCDDADALYAELVERGLALDPPTTAYYGMRQVFVPDPDGHSVCFESPTEDWSEGVPPRTSSGNT